MRTLFLWLLLWLAGDVLAQKRSLAELQADLHTQQGEDRFNTLLQIGRTYSQSNPDSALHFLNEAKRVADSLQSPLAQLKALRQLGSLATTHNDYPTALAHFDAVLRLAEQEKQDTFWVNAVNFKGYIFTQTGKPQQALELYFAALERAKQLQLRPSECDMLYAIGDFYRLHDEPLKGIAYLQQAEALAKALPDARREAKAMTGLSNAYSKIDSLQLALNYLLRSFVPPYTDTYEPLDSARTLGNIGRMYQMLMDFDNAEKYLFQAIEYDRAHRFNQQLAHALNELMTVYKKKKEYDKALIYGLEALSLMPQVKQVFLHRNIQRHLSEIYAAKGDFTKAYAHRLQFEVLADSVTNTENAAALSELELKYQNQQTLLTKENQLRIASLQRNIAMVGIGLLVVAAFLFFRWWLQKKRREAERLEIRARELNELDQLKSRFFANISHELRTPLTLILGSLDAIGHRRYGEINDMVQKAVQTVQRNSRQLLQMVEEILDLSRLEANRMEIKERAVALKPFIKRLFSAFESGTTLKNIRYQLTYLLDDDFIVQTDPDKLEKIFNNLVGNALKFTPQNGEIALNVNESAQPGFIQITCKDSGRGIHPDDLPHIFERYFQTSRPDAPLEGGTGIGLALSKELAEALGGSLTVKSKWEKGSVFILEIPVKEGGKAAVVDKVGVVDEAAGRWYQSENGASAGTMSANASILLVEDNPEMQEYIQEMLAPMYRVETAANGKIALERLREQGYRPDLIISDVMMPEMDGFTLLEALKSDEKLLGIPVVMLTARADLKDKLRALTIGVDDYLTKPFVAEELLVRVHNLLARVHERQSIAVETEPAADDDTRPITPADLRWLQTVEQIVQREMKNSNFNLLQLADELAMSDRQLHRRIKRITGLTPNKYFREIKLNAARDLIEQGLYSTLSEVAYAVGFDTPQYFTKLYTERFGKRPVL